jgi:hypothetical protein
MFGGGKRVSIVTIGASRSDVLNMDIPPPS